MSGKQNSATVMIIKSLASGWRQPTQSSPSNAAPEEMDPKAPAILLDNLIALNLFSKREKENADVVTLTLPDEQGVYITIYNPNKINEVKSFLSNHDIQFIQAPTPDDNIFYLPIPGLTEVEDLVAKRSPGMK